MKKLNSFLLILFATISVFIIMGCDTRQETKQPEACFNYVPTSGIHAGDEVTFTNCSTDAESYEWDFDDGDNSVTSDPKHVFTDPGSYTVVLIVQNKNLRDQTEQTITVESNIVACFTMAPNPAEVNESVSFTNCSTEADAYEWNFGDGQTSTLISPTHSFSSAGNFDITLIAKKGSDSEQIVHSITVTAPSVTACFDMSTTSAEVGETVVFTNCSVGATRYDWDADGNGTTDYTTEDLSIFYYFAGTYNVKLTAWNGTESDSDIQTIVITDPGGVIDPEVYDMPVSWTGYYVNEFDATGDWLEGTTADYSASISGGVYTINNTNAENTWFFWTNTIGMPATSENYDFEVYSIIDFDNVTQGDGIFSSLDENASPFAYNFLKLSYIGSTSYYTYGNNNNGPWDDGFYGTDGYVGAYNKLTIRKYESTLYFFLNEVFKNSVPFEGNYGERFGFIVGADSKVTTEWIAIWNVSTKKSGAPGKPFALSGERNHGKDMTTFKPKAKSYQTQKQAKKMPGKTPSLK